MRFKYLLLIIFSLNVIPLFAVEQDSLTFQYLEAKDEAIEFLSKQDKAPDEATVLAKLQQKLGNCGDIEQAAYYIQFCNKYRNTSVVADSLLLKAEHKLSHHKCERGLGEALFYMGMRAINKQDVDELHKCFYSASKHFKNSGYEFGQVSAISRIANFYSKHDNYELANKYYQETLLLANSIDDVNVKEMVYLNVANFYNEQSETEKALTYYNKLEQSIKVSGNTRRLKPLYNNLGVIYYFEHNWPKAKEYLNKSLAIKIHENDSLGMFGSYQNLYRISLKTRQLQDAKYYYSVLSNLSEKIHIPADQKIAFQFNTTDYHILSGNTHEALTTFHAYTSIKDSISNAVFSKKLVGLEESLEIERRDKEIALLQQKDEMQQAEVKNLQVIIIFIILFIIVLLANGFYMKRQWLKLLKADEELKFKQSEIISVNKRLELSNKSKERILSVIGHDLRGPVGGLKELVELYLELPELEPNDVVNLLKAARESSSNAYYLLENLLTWANSQRGDISFRPQIIPIYPVVKRSVDLLDQSINNKNIRLKIDIDHHLNGRIDVNMFRTIIRNLVSNAIKHSDNNSQVMIRATSQDGGICFVVSDAGLGMSADETRHIFEKKETFYIGSDVSKKGSGLGLILCKEFVERHNGSIWVESEKGVGTNVCFTIPSSNNMNRLLNEQELVSAENA